MSFLMFATSERSEPVPYRMTATRPDGRNQLEGRVLIDNVLVTKLGLTVINTSPNAIGFSATITQFAKALIHVVDVMISR